MRCLQILMAGACAMSLSACTGTGSLLSLPDSLTSGLPALTTAATQAVAGAGTASGSNEAANSPGTGTTTVEDVQGSPGNSGAPGAPGVPGSLLGTSGLLSSGLGVTGNPGLISFVLGSDPVGGVVSNVLGANNGVSQLLGTPADASTPALIPSVLDAVTGQSSAPVLSGGLGLDSVTPLTTALLGDQGAIPSSLAGGSSSLLAPVLDTSDLSAITSQTGLANGVTGILASAPQLGISGNGGLAQDLLGSDVTGNLLGTQTGIPAVLAGGENGAAGQILDGVSPQLQPVQTGLSNATASLTGGASGPLSGILNAGSPTQTVSSTIAAVQGVTGAVPGLNPVLSTATGGLTSAAPSLSGLTSGVTPAVTSVLNSVTAPVTGGTSGLTSGTVPVVTNALNTVIAPVTGNALTNTLNTVTGRLTAAGIPTSVPGSILGGLH